MVVDSPHQTVPGLSRQILSTLGGLTIRRIYRQGDVLCQQGERPDRVLFIEDGLCKLTSRMANGEQALVGLRPRGWPIGSVSALLREEQPFAVEAASRCIALEVAVPHFLACFDTNPVVARALLGIHNAKLDEARTIHLLGLASVPARARVEMLLSWLYRARIGIRGVNGSEPVVGSLSQREMADLLAMTPETVTRTLKVLEREARIQKRNGWITLLAADDPCHTDPPIRLTAREGSRSLI